MRKRAEKIDNFINRKYNYLTIISLAEPTYRNIKNGKKKKCTNWLCKCDCGKEKIIPHSNVASGVIKSCGCKRHTITRGCIQKYYKEKYKEPVENILYKNYLSDCNNSNRIFNISKEQFTDLVNSNCYYCGCKPFLVRYNRTKSVSKALNGIDRVNSSIGYIIENCVPCCIYCNRAKNTMNINEFKNWVILIYNNLYPNEKGR